MAYGLTRRLIAEGLGTAVLVAAIVGSGVMAEGLADDPAFILLANALTTGAILAVLIAILGPVSGAYFNPAVTLIVMLSRQIGAAMALAYVIAQIAGGIMGTVLAHVMFDLQPVQTSQTSRTGVGQWTAEAVATFGLVFTILSGSRFRAHAVPWLVGLYIAAACWFTASTAFANPAVTIARAFTDTFAGIHPSDVPGFVVAQIIGAVAAAGLARWLLPKPDTA